MIATMEVHWASDAFENHQVQVFGGLTKTKKQNSSQLTNFHKGLNNIPVRSYVSCLIFPLVRMTFLTLAFLFSSIYFNF